MDDPHAEVEIKPQIKPRGGVAKEEDPNPPTSGTSSRLNPQDQPGRLCDCGRYKGHRAPAKEDALVLIAGDMEATTQSRTGLESELPPQQVQRPAQCWRASQGGEVDCDSQQAKGL